LLWSLLESWEEKKRTLLSTIILGCIIMLCWANIHGGFLLGFAISVIFLMGEILNMVILQKKSYPIQACIILIALILATTINPWGVYLHKHLILFLNNEFLISGTSDFQPPVFSNGTIYALIFLLFIVWLPLLLQWRKVKLHEWLLVVCLSIASAKWMRNIPFLGILACPIAAKYLQTFFSSSLNHNIKMLLLSSKRLSQEEKGAGWFWGTSIFLLATFFIGSGLFSISLIGKLVPIKGLDWVKKHSEYYQQPVLADYLYAGYLLHETPVKKVFLHALNANYSEVRLLTWIAIADGKIGWEKRLGDIKWAFLKRGSPQMASFLKSSYWRPIYEDNMVVVFNRF